MLRKSKTKFFSVLLISFIVLSFILSTYAITYATTNGSYLVERNLQTGKVTTREYPNTSLSTRSNIFSTESYIPENVMPKRREITGGNDSRSIVQDTSVFPFSTICQLEITFEDGSKANGTAFMVYSNYAYTAGHCVLDPEHGFVTSIRVIPGRNGRGNESEPFGDAWVTNVEYDYRWETEFHDDEDWAFLTLDRHIGNNTGWQGIACSDDYSYFETDRVVLSVLGYPRPDVRDYRQYTGLGPVVKANGMHLIYDIDTEGGQSGGPVRQGDYAIGIHTNWTTINGNIYNECSNITRARFEGFLSKIN